MIQMLLKAGDNIHEAPGRFRRSLLLATKHGHKEILTALLAAGADPNAWSGQAIQCASSAGNEVLVRVLIAGGADVNSGNGRVLRHVAAGGA
jgi:ankyrin repeat protein